MRLTWILSFFLMYAYLQMLQFFLMFRIQAALDNHASLMVVNYYGKD